MFALLAELSLAQNQSPVALDTNETLFTVQTAINTCGYDQDLRVSDPLRSRVREEVARIRQGSQAAEDTAQAMCQYYQEHQQPEPSKALAQYVSLALYLNPPPLLTAKVKDADMPPDAALVLGILPLMQKFSETVGLHARKRLSISSDGPIDMQAAGDMSSLAEAHIIKARLGDVRLQANDDVVMLGERIKMNC